MKKSLILCFAILCVCAMIPASAFASAKSEKIKDKSCYSAVQVQAEELLRLHSELMVIAITCHQGSGGEKLVPAYTKFTRDNIDDISKAESVIKAYYKTKHEGDGTAQLDVLRTKLGNESGQTVADLSSPAFCDMYRDKVVAFSQNIPGHVENEVARMTSEVPTLVPPCKGAILKVADKNR